MTEDLWRRCLAVAIGTAFLVAAVIGSGVAAQRLSPSDVGLQLLENSLITGAALGALILALQPISAAFNPIVTLVELADRAISARGALSVVIAQFAGGVVGAVIANLMFDLDAITISQLHRAAGGLWLGEAVATLGLVLIVFGTARIGLPTRIAIAVGGYITAAYWFTSSTSFANPASASPACSATRLPAFHRTPRRCPSSCIFSAVLPRIFWCAPFTHAAPDRT